VGPVAPIDPRDFPYKAASRAEILWRYMDFTKFADLMTSSSIYFSRGDRFTDPFEGRFSEANAEKLSNSDQAFLRLYKVSPPDPEHHEIMRRVVFISCWHRATKDSRKMWDAYTRGAESVVVVSSVNALTRFLPDRIKKSGVKYHGVDFARTAFGWTTLFFYKPAFYRFENEFRLLLAPGEGESVPEDQLGKHVPVRLSRVIHRVITHPRATDAFKMEVDRIMARHLKGKRRENSTLLP
jgi:hypothetical protein